MVSDSGLAGRVGRAGALQLSITGRFPLISTFELSQLRARMFEAARAKAGRGELRIPVPPGYIWDRDAGLAVDPDERLQATIRETFGRFRRLGSARQVLLSLKEDGFVAHPLDGQRGRADGARAVYSAPKAPVEHTLSEGALERAGMEEGGSTRTDGRWTYPISRQAHQQQPNSSPRAGTSTTAGFRHPVLSSGSGGKPLERRRTEISRCRGSPMSLVFFGDPAVRRASCCTAGTTFRSDGG